MNTIQKIQWFRLSDLPTWRRNKTVPGKFYLISPFIGFVVLLYPVSVLADGPNSPLKAFIHDRKPRNLPRRNGQSQAAHAKLNALASSEDDVANLDSYPSTNGDHAQESSSQSSSADNGEPQTPSPQYSAPHVNYQPPSHLEPHDEAAEINLDGVDPHFARLLSSLTLSASATAIENAKPPISEQRATSPQAPISSSISSLPQSSDLRADWSATMPHRSEPRVHAKHSVQTEHLSRSPLASAASTVVSASLHGHPNGTQGPHAQRPPSSHGMVNNAQAKQSPRLARARRASRASADISPYLSRPHDIQKEMKYISLLENVAKESDRLSSHLARQTPSLPDSLHSYSGSSASIPPTSTFGRHEVPLLYSSTSAAGSAYPPSTAMPPLESIHDDPFTVRPRTSNAFHPLPYPPPSRKASLHEDRLRFMTPGLESITPRAPGLGPFPPVAHGPANGIPRPASMAPLRVVPPTQYSMYEGPPNFSQMSGPPLSPSAAYGTAAAIPPPMPVNPMRAANNAQLLSILNTPSTAPRPLAAPGLMSVNGVGPR